MKVNGSSQSQGDACKVDVTSKAKLDHTKGIAQFKIIITSSLGGTHTWKHSHC